MNNSKKLVYLILSCTLLALLSAAPMAAPAAGSKAAKGTAANTSSFQEIEYADLVEKIGHKLVISTTNNTTRKGELTRFTNVTLTLQMGPDAGSIELSVPRDSIRKIMIEVAPADPLFLNEETSTEGKAGAKKN